MADALCGPSNALQSFQKHTAVDRTLQQDRHTSHKTDLQGFRSAPGPNAGILDAEFEAFQAGRSPHLLQRSHEHEVIYDHRAGIAVQQPYVADWVSDFQDLRINGHHPLTSTPERVNSTAYPHHQSASAWHLDFQSQDRSAPAIQGRPQHTGVGNGPSFAPIGRQTLPQYRQHHSAQIPVSPLHEQVPLQAISNEAFEKEFQEADKQDQYSRDRAEVDAQNPVDTYGGLQSADQRQTDNVRISRDALLRQDATSQKAETLTEDLHRLPASIPELPMSKSEEDPIREREKPEQGRDEESEEIRQKTDDDELARTAGTLLENVSHDQSQKFKESNFLSLMRQLRDRDVKVQGDKIVGVS